MTPQENFITYIRTKQIMTLRLKNATEMEATHIDAKEIEMRFFPYPKYKRKEEINKLVDKGLIEVSKRGKGYYYSVNKAGKFDLSLLQKREIPTDQLTRYIYNNLQKVSLAPESESTNFFNLFLKYQNKAPYLFFNVDTFCKRIHTPISGLHRKIRPNLLIDNELTVSIDLTTAQPLILSKILFNEIGENDFTNWVNSGKDVYMMLLEKGGYENRDLAKKGFLKILFSPDLNFVERTFGKKNWTDWIIKYKSELEPRNPKPKIENLNPHYNNLAFLLQSTEVSIMKKVWQRLAAVNIPFLTVHDSIIIKQSDQAKAFDLFNEVMQIEFPKYYHLHTEELKKPEKVLNDLLPNELIAIQKQYLELEQHGIIQPQHYAIIKDLWQTVGSCLRNNNVGLKDIINELITYKQTLRYTQ